MYSQHKLFHPSSVALIGASDRAGSVGRVFLRNLRRGKDHRLLAHDPGVVFAFDESRLGDGSMAE